MQLKQLLWLLLQNTIQIQYHGQLNPDIISATLNREKQYISLQAADGSAGLRIRQQSQAPGAARSAGTLLLQSPQPLTTVLTAVQTLLQQDYAASNAIFELAQKSAHWTIQRILDALATTYHGSFNILDRRQQVVFAAMTQRIPAAFVDHWHWLRPVVPQRPTLEQVGTTVIAALPFQGTNTLLLLLDQAQRPRLGFYWGLLRRLAQLLVQPFAKQTQAALPASAAVFSDTLLDLIHSQTIDPQVLAHWPLTPRQNHYLLTSSFQVTLNPVIIQDFLKNLTPLLGQLHYCLENTNLVVLFGTDQPLNTLRHQLTRLHQMAVNYDFLLTFSMPFQQLEQVGAAYRQCVTTQAYAHTAALPDRILFFQDVSLLNLIDQVRGQTSLDAYIHPDLRYLQDYDQQHHTDYLETLHFYLYFDCQTAPAAQALHIHPNTLLYRIGKIKTLLDYQLDFGKQNLDYRMGYLILYSQNQVARPQTRPLTPPADGRLQEIT